MAKMGDTPLKHPNHVRRVCMLQEWFKHPNHVSVYCRSASNTPIISGVHIAGMLQTPQPCQGCIMLQEWFKHPNHVSVCLQECFKHPNNIRGSYCRNASNTPIMSGCMYVAGMVQTSQSCQCMFAGTNTH